MCPFAHVLTSANLSQVLIPQRQVIKNHFKQKDHISLPVHLSKESQIETGVYDKAVIILSMNTHQEPDFSRSIITTNPEMRKRGVDLIVNKPFHVDQVIRLVQEGMKLKEKAKKESNQNNSRC